MVALMKCGGLTKEDVAKRLLCFGADGTSIFHKGHKGRQIKDVWAPFSMGVHCVAHNSKLVF